MTLREFYAGIDGSYDEAIKRLMNEKLMLKYLGKFADSGDYAAMMAAAAAKDWEAVFRYSHNLKGVCLNLELGRLSRSASALCDSTRNGPPAGDISELVSAVAADYALVMESIRAVQASQG